VAWRSYLEALSDQRPLVLVFEDLHWADDGLLDFIDLLVDQVGDVPLLVVTTARPELLERRPGWGGGKHDATTLDLSPLSDDQTERIIEHVLQRVVLPQETRLILLERAGGNPLYAEQFSELYLERGSAESLPPPETLQGIIAARIDGLPDSEKAVLQDASVVGKVFWPGALGRAAAELDAPLTSLARKGFLTRQRRSSVADEDEWAFAHILLRDVAYAQIARADRSDKHQRTAVWLEALGRPEEHAALIAYHWHTAYELAHAAGQPVTALEEPTRLALRAAGERAFAINAYPEAARHFEAALALWPADDRQRPGLRYRQAEALFTADTPDAPDVLKTIRDEFAASGQRELHAGTELMLSILARHAGWTDDARSHEAAAEALVGDSTSLIATRVQSYGARRRVVFSGDVELGSEMAARALSMADAVDSDELRVHALETIGIAKLYQGRPGGRDDLEAALAIATSVRSPRLSGLTSNLAVLAFREMRYRRAHELTVEALRIAKQLGDAARVRLGRAHMASDQLILGDWDEAMRNADAFIAECEAGAASDSECDLRGDRAIVRAARGDLDGANDDALRALDLARAQGSPQDVLPALSMAILVFEETGSDGDLGVLSSELVELAERNAHEAPWSLGLGFPCSRVAGRHAESVRRVLDAAPDSPYKPLVLACLDGDFARAADMFEEAGSPTWEARLRLRAAEALAEAGRRDESRTQARLALAFHRKVGANRYIERERQLLEGSA
jgi:tetratricopeptide (TPR) repeat protein